MESVPIFLFARSYEGRTALVPKNGVCPHFLFLFYFVFICALSDKNEEVSMNGCITGK
jgi:hypothetical protein